MPEASQQKNHFQLNSGLNTEANEIGFPDGYTTDERNYELLVDGSRRRRKGLAQETGGSAKDPSQTIGAAHASVSYNWTNVAGVASKRFIVHQIGSELYFTNDAELISTTYHSQVIPIAGYVVDSSTYAVADIEDEVCQFSMGRGVLLVTHKHLRPFYVEYNATTDTFTSTAISIAVRDFDGIDDGIPVQSTPSTLTDDHRYNLRNRGWIEADIESGSSPSYFDVQGNYPSKAMVWYKGYRRQTDVTYSDLDGIQTFDSAKLAAERFGSSSASQGSLLLDPLDTRYSGTTSNEGDEVSISTIALQTGTLAAGGTYRITTAAVHGRSTNDFVTISGTQLTHDWSIFPDVVLMDIDGYYQIDLVSTTEFDITFQALNESNLTFGTVTQTGQINGNVSLPKSDGKALSVGPTAVAYHAGRAWFAGIQDSEWADTVFFSKIALKPSAFGVCHQENDPTNPELNQLSSSDGGTIVIPNLGNVKRMLPLRDALLVFTDNGVWEIGGSQRGAFTAGSYSVRKITESECSSARSPVVIGSRALYTGPRGIHLIEANRYTYQLEEINISEDLVQSLWNGIPTARQEVVQTVYDNTLQRIYFLYDDAATTQADATSYTSNINQYNSCLVLDLRIKGYYKYVFNTSATSGILSAYALTDADESDNNKRIKFTVQATNTVVTCDLDQTDYVDYNSAESPLPYLLTGWDNLGDFQRRKQAPIITVFAKRTETGYTATGNGWDADNESSNLLTAYWDWTDDSISGKIGSQNETYRHTRGFVPASATDVDGYPVVTTRNKVRGRGRVLQLRFDGAATKDSHILGFTTNYKISRSV